MAASASPHRGMSPAARAKRKRGMLTWGIILLVLWLLISSGVAAFLASDPNDNVDFGVAFSLTQGLMWLPLLLGLIFTIIGVVAGVRARAFDLRDRASAAALTGALQQFLQTPQQAAYASDPSLEAVESATLVEADRHFDQDTQGQMVTTINHRMNMFGTQVTSTSGTSHYGGGDRVNSYSTSLGTLNATGHITGTETTTMSETTRANLMGDALFSVFEYPTAAGGRDTYRVVSMSRPAADGWIRDLVASVCYQVGGPDTHAGGAVWAFSEHIVQHFSPGDISYVTDRLKAILARPVGERERVRIEGVPMARGAMVATTVAIDGAAPLHLYPVHFPRLFADSVNSAARRSVELQRAPQQIEQGA